MHIEEKIINEFGGEKISFKKHEVIFRQGSIPRFYYQVNSGNVRMFNISENAREYTQGFFGPGNSFGEPPLILDKPYPAIAEAVQESTIYRLPKQAFRQILINYPELNQQFIELLALRTYKKSVINSEIILGTPAMRIHCLLTFYKQQINTKEPILIPYTRQEIANLTGLRVETVIRTILRMQAEKVIAIKDKKIFF